ncbi:MAG: hypothetical protein M2R45_02198 [Verrucomicrobia subdivision 3 bacterium]|nr:hypothetical protein [Limisphaerales bacterium]MCS1413774.1 hypothetical protein [Limisphaerales bacterium]
MFFLRLTPSGIQATPTAKLKDQESIKRNKARFQGFPAEFRNAGRLRIQDTTLAKEKNSSSPKKFPLKTCIKKIENDLDFSPPWPPSRRSRGSNISRLRSRFCEIGFHALRDANGSADSQKSPVVCQEKISMAPLGVSSLLA